MATGIPSVTDNLKKSDDYSSISMSIGAAITAVQALPDMNDDLMLDAIDFLSSENSSVIFIALDPKLRRKWLVRKLPQHRQHLEDEDDVRKQKWMRELEEDDSYQSDDELEVFRKLEPIAMEIGVKTLCGKKYTLDVLSSDTIADVKIKIQVKEGTEAKHQRLIYAGRNLEDDKTVAESGLRNDSVCHMLRRLCGC